MGGDALVTPISRPGVRRSSGGQAGKLDFVRHPDAHAKGEWVDARFVFAFCDGTLSVHDIISRTMLGAFRTLAALVALVEEGHVQLLHSRLESDPSASAEMVDLIAALA